MVDIVQKGITALSVAPQAAAGLVVPDPQSGVPLAGVASNLYGFADLVARMGTGALASTVAPSAANPQDSIVKQIIDETSAIYHRGIGLPGAETVAAAGERAKQSANEMLPALPANTADERIAQAVVRGGVEMGVGIPGLARAPKLLQTAAHILAPGTAGGRAGAVANGIGGTIGGLGATGAEFDDAAPHDDTAIMSTFPGMSPTDTAPQQQGGITPAASPSAPAPLPQATPDATLFDPVVSSFPTGAPAPTEFDALVHASGDSHVSWAQLASYTGMAGGVILGHRFLSGVMRDSVTAAREARYNRGQALLDADAQGRLSGTIGPGTPQPEVPLPPQNASPLVPEALTALSNKMRGKVVNKNSPLDSVNDYYSGGRNTDMAENLRGQTGTLLNEGYVGQRIRTIAETGHDSHSGVSMPSPIDSWNRIGTWDAETKLRLSNAEYAADELDSRAIRARDMHATPQTAETRVGFGGYDDARLQQYVDAGYADPRVAFELQENTVRNARMAELLEGSGMIDSAAAAKFKNDHPNYLPTADTRGIIADPLSARDYTNMAGPDAAYVDSWELRRQHFESVIKSREQNIARANIVENALDFQRNNPQAPKMFVERTDAAGNPVKGDTSVGYRVGGQLKWVDVNNSALRNMIDTPPAAQSAIIQAMSGVSAISRSGTTQALSSIGGSFFQVKNALRTNIRVGIAARPELYTGYLDRAVGKATGDMVRLHGGLDPTFFLNPVVGTAKNAYGGLLNGGLRLLDDSGPLNPFRATLKTAFGDEGYQAMIERMKIAYARSTRGRMEEAGALNAVGMGGNEIPTSQIASRTGQYSVLNATAPELFLDKGAFGGVKPTFVRLNNLLQEVTSWIGESAQTAHFALNENNATLARRFGADAGRQLAFYTRQSAGDVGQKGASPIFRDYAAVSKYANVAVQDWANLTDAFGRAPGLTTMNIATVLGLPALATIYTAMLHGPDAINHLFNELTNDQRVANLHFYIPGQAPENSPSYPFSQNERVFLAPIVQLFADMANLQAHPGDDTYQWFKHGLEDLFAKHITEGTIGGMERGLASATEVMVPDAMQVALAATSGKRMQVNPVDMIAGGDKPLDQRMMVPAQSVGAPRQANVASDDDINAGAITGKMFWNVFSAVFGAVGAGVHQDWQAATQNYALHHDIGDALTTAKESYFQRSEAAIPFLKGVVWNSPERLSTGTPLAESVRRATDAYRPLLTMHSDMANEGYTRRGGLELAPTPGSTPKVPTDPTMLQMSLVASKMGQKLLSGPGAPMQEVQDWQKVISALPSSGRPVAEIRELNNRYARAKEQALQKAAEFINDGNMMLSQIVGKQVDIRKIDWRKGPEQFNSR